MVFVVLCFLNKKNIVRSIKQRKIYVEEEEGKMTRKKSGQSCLCIPPGSYALGSAQKGGNNNDIKEDQQQSRPRHQERKHKSKATESKKCLAYTKGSERIKSDNKGSP
mmetsp:Transcript_52445/g.59962  ORF Transcript_52445/g.59962 Transcript_52445/m.59962 type:complete len:108 (+) Transcript_52445:47-370(+)